MCCSWNLISDICSWNHHGCWNLWVFKPADLGRPATSGSDHLEVFLRPTETTWVLLAFPGLKMPYDGIKKNPEITFFCAKKAILNSAEAAGGHLQPLHTSEKPPNPTGAQLDHSPWSRGVCQPQMLKSAGVELVDNADPPILLLNIADNAFVLFQPVWSLQ